MTIATPIKLFETVQEAKQALDRASEVFGSVGASELDKLKAFKDAMRAELTISSLVCDHDDFDDASPVFEESYRQAQEMFEYYQKAMADADKEYNSLIQKAKRARHTRMRTWFVNMPEGLKASELASWDERTGWRMEVSY